MMSAKTEHSSHSVLIVDDEHSVRNVLRVILQDEGYEVLEASNGAEALDLMKTFLPCIVLSDINMPKMNGFELCKRIRQTQQTAHVPVMLFSALCSQADIDQGIKAGAVDYIRKPIEKIELCMRLKSQIKLHESAHANKSLLNKLNAICSAALDAIILMDNDGKITLWNNSSQAMFGYSQDEALGRDLHHLICPKRYHPQQSRAFVDFQISGTGGALGKTTEMAGLHKDGHQFPIELSLSKVLVNNKWCAVGIVRDISERVKNRKRLAAEEMSFRQMFHSVKEGIALIDPQTYRLVMVNESMCSMLGYRQEELLALEVAALFGAESSSGESISDNRQRFEDLQTAQNLLLAHKDGKKSFVEISSVHVEFSGHEQLLVCFRDVTEQNRLAAELSQARKLEAVGQLASGIAHEINTPVQFVNDSIHFLKESFEDLSQLRVEYRKSLDQVSQTYECNELLSNICEAEEEADLTYLEENIPGSFEQCIDGLTRITSIVKAMKEFAHPNQSEQNSADINQAIRSTLTIAKNEYKYVADIELDLEDLHPVRCNIGELNQVFLNLIVNAAHAIDDANKGNGNKGKIQIRTRQTENDVKIEIEDSGKGIPKDIQEHIFEPFFTTKEVGIGSGQGLAIAHTVIEEKHHGSLTFHTQEGKGTVFIIQIPISGKTSADAA